MSLTIKEMEDTVHRLQKYPDFITEQSNGITLEMVCNANEKIKHAAATFRLNEVINNMNISREIEAGVFEYTMIYMKNNNLSFSLITSVYNHKIDDLITNIKYNPNIIADITSGQVKPRMVAFLSPQQLFPDKWSDLLAKKRIKEEKENNLPTVDTYVCRKCGQRKCTLRSLQTRSIDEPMTIFVTCCNCFNTFTV